MYHSQMDIEIGTPAVIMPGDKYPKFTIFAKDNVAISGEIIHIEKDSIFNQFDDRHIPAWEESQINFQGNSNIPGIYRVNFIIKQNNNKYFESYYFRVLDQSLINYWNSVIVHPGKDSKLTYTPDYRGNRIPDFSHAGYKGGGIEIPESSVKVVLSPHEGDDTKRIQEAINYVSSLEPDINGIRGAVLLAKGVYEIKENISINTGGVILRGEGKGDFEKLMLDPSLDLDLEQFKKYIEPIDATVLIATGKERRRLIHCGGDSGLIVIDSVYTNIIDQYVPVGATSFRVNNSELFEIGDKIIIQRTGNKEWINEIGMNEIPDRNDKDSLSPNQWEPFNMNFENEITDIKGNIISVNIPVLNAIESRWGGGGIYKYCDKGRIENVGIENLRAISFWQLDKYGSDDTRHSSGFISLGSIKNSWIINTVAEHFTATGGGYYIGLNAKKITISNSSNLVADRKFYSGEGYRGDRTRIDTDVEVGRYGFSLLGQSTLVVNCFTMNNRRSFVISAHHHFVNTAALNVFLGCKAKENITTSEPHQRWSVAGLYDNVDDDITFMNRLNLGRAHGWAGAYYVAWNTRGFLINEQPPTAQNWAIGHKGEKKEGRFYEYHGRDGYWEKTGINIQPRSLYIQQLIDRKGKNVSDFIVFNFMRVQKNIEENDIKILCFPNPADYFTRFAFELKQSSKVEFSLFTLEGRKIKKINLGEKDEGYYEIFWPTKDNNNNLLKNGIYIYRFKINDKYFSNKLVIFR